MIPGAGTAPKRYRAGTHRVCPPEETWERIRPLLPRAGITRVADVTGLDRLGIPVAQAVRPASLNLSVSQGKGASIAAARVSAAMEALELWHAEDLGHLPQIEMSLREMRGADVPMDALRFAADAVVLDGARLAWVRARSLTADAETWLPRAMLELDFRLDERLPPRLFRLTSNGLASGNVIEEALLHGLCELVERDALAAIERDPARKRPIDLAAAEDAHTRAATARARAAGFKLAAWDVTGDRPAPVVVVDLVAADLPQRWRGSGCHPSGAVAVSRALTEAAQSRLTYISGARDDVVGLRPVAPETAFDAFETPEAGDPPPVCDASDDAGRDLERLVRALGRPVFFVDLTREDVGLPVAFVFVPGLRDPLHG